MNKFIRNLIAAATLTAITASAYAASGGIGADANSFVPDGTVNFTGELIATACTVDTGSQALTVDLGKVPVRNFSSEAQSLTGRKEFTVKVTGCPEVGEDETALKAAVRFQGTAVGDGVIALDAGSTATGVGIQLRDKDDNIVRLQEDAAAITLAEGDNDLNFVAYYVSTSATAPTPGSVSAHADFLIIYQ